MEKLQKTRNIQTILLALLFAIAIGGVGCVAFGIIKSIMALLWSGLALILVSCFIIPVVYAQNKKTKVYEAIIKAVNDGHTSIDEIVEQTKIDRKLLPVYIQYCIKKKYIDYIQI